MLYFLDLSESLASWILSFIRQVLAFCTLLGQDTGKETKDSWKRFARRMPITEKNHALRLGPQR